MVQMVQPASFFLKDDGSIPNNTRLPVLIYRAAIRVSETGAAEAIEQLLEGNNWSDSWRNGIYSFHHYHSTAHEVLVIARGSANVQLGGENGITEADLLVHDINLEDPSVAFMLARMEQPDFPQPVGVFRAVERPSYDQMLVDQIDTAVAKSGPGSLEKLIYSGDMWTVE